MKVTTVNSTKKINLEEYINSDTGEQLSSELRGGIVISKSKTDMVNISSDDYVILDAKALLYLSQYLNRSELGSIYVMSSDLKTEINIIYNNNIPHTNETLQNKLGIASPNTFNLLMKKLMKFGVVYQIKGRIMGSVRVIYMMNPFLARKRKTIHKDIIEIFDEFRKKVS